MTTSFSGHRDPFGTMCIHGVLGARIIDGQKKSPDCSNCFPLLWKFTGTDDTGLRLCKHGSPHPSDPLFGCKICK